MSPGDVHDQEDLCLKIIVLARRHPVAAYFGVAYALSAVALLGIAAPKLSTGPDARSMNPLLAFPLMVVGLGLAAIALTGNVDGRSGLRDLFSRMRRWRVSARWYAAALLIPPVSRWGWSSPWSWQRTAGA